MRRTTVHELLAEARRDLRRVEPGEALREMETGAVLIDLRSHDERARHGVVPGALHVPYSVLEWRVDPDSEHRNPHVPGLEARLILFCAQGYSSSLAAASLQRLGFANAADLVGGFAAWKAAGLPVRGASAPAEGLPGMGGPDPES
jgi:rhodanese-related sulfurtransferase